jgi:hypothetical protein
MQYYVPVIRLSEELPPQRGPLDKLGGIPWGLKAQQWPMCRSCGKSQSLLAQFVHHSLRCDLGREGRVLHIFQCDHDPGMCPTWEGGSGANACFVTEPEDMLNSLSALPPDSPSIEREVIITEWLTREDGIPAARTAAFYSDEGIDTLSEGENSKVTSGTRLGSVPFWIQSAAERPQGDWRFIGQLDSTYSFTQAPAVNTPGVHADPERWEGRTHCCGGPNFGDGGIAYLSLRNTPPKPEGWIFWQCG